MWIRLTLFLALAAAASAQPQQPNPEVEVKRGQALMAKAPALAEGFVGTRRYGAFVHGQMIGCLQLTFRKSAAADKDAAVFGKQLGARAGDLVWVVEERAHLRFGVDRSFKLTALLGLDAKLQPVVTTRHLFNSVAGKDRTATLRSGPLEDGVRLTREYGGKLAELRLRQAQLITDWELLFGKLLLAAPVDQPLVVTSLNDEQARIELQRLRRLPVVQQGAGDEARQVTRVQLRHQDGESELTLDATTGEVLHQSSSKAPFDLQPISEQAQQAWEAKPLGPRAEPGSPLDVVAAHQAAMAAGDVAAFRATIELRAFCIDALVLLDRLTQQQAAARYDKDPKKASDDFIGVTLNSAKQRKRPTIKGYYLLRMQPAQVQGDRAIVRYREGRVYAEYRLARGESGWRLVSLPRAVHQRRR